MGYIIGFVVYLYCALIMVGIGLAQFKSKEPVAFYSGEKPPRREKLTDVSAWNKKHGKMWIVYGVIIMISYFISLMIGDSVWIVIPLCGGVVVPLIFMMRYHNKLKKEYMR